MALKECDIVTRTCASVHMYVRYNVQFVNNVPVCAYMHMYSTSGVQCTHMNITCTRQLSTIHVLYDDGSVINRGIKSP